ncbi:hypothetical protein R3W88_004779 [Solanum pinnatisectum]|uniref:Uncharacterized protein n=1 Tax=Solanum pinnatisectum TaxID=50273 RepID=A0AAV9KAB3_9SOLN|nr:hypothetical protein R3W88_004779 [Solanum pinnatisectum]
MTFSTISYPIIINIPYRKCRMINKKLSHVRAQSNKDEVEKDGRRSWHAHLQVLRERVEKVKIKERLEKSLACKQGWNYYSTTTRSTCYVKKHKKKIDYVSQIVEFFMVICGTLSFTILGCTLCLYLTSILIHNLNL